MDINFSAAINSMRYLAALQQAQRSQFEGYDNMMSMTNNMFDSISNFQGDVFAPANRTKFSSMAKAIDNMSFSNRRNDFNINMLSKMYDYAEKRYQQYMKQN